MLRAGLDLVLLQVKGSRLASKAKIYTACITELRAGLAPAPDRGVVGAAMAAFRANVVGIRFVRSVAIIGVRIDEDLRPQTVALLEVKAASVAKRLESGRISPPERCRSSLAMRTLLGAVGFPGAATSGKCWALDRAGNGEGVVV